jgi:hypothetical protein
MNDRLLTAALYYAEQGLSVLPVWPILNSGNGLVCGCGKVGEENNHKPGKHPLARLAPHGVKEATRDPDTLKRWWREHPNANIGVTGTIILDIDRRHGGLETLVTLEEQHGPLPRTWTARSPSSGGGPHYFYRGPSDTEIGDVLGPGIDVRGRGMYVVAAPSRHIEGGEYTWELWPHKTPLAELPEWVIEAAAKPARGEPVPVGEWRDVFCNGIDDGVRNNTFPRLAGHLLGKRVDPIVVSQLLLSWNQTNCRPPLPEDEVLQIIDRIAARELRKREALGK